MKKLIVIVLVCSMSLVGLQGCIKQNKNHQNSEVTDNGTLESDSNNTEDSDKANQEEVEAKDKEETDVNKQDKLLLDDLKQMIGQDDKKVQELLGEGTVEKNEAGEVGNIAFSNISFLGETVELNVLFDQAKCYSSIFSVTGTEFDYYESRLKDVLGSPIRSDGTLEEEGSGAKRITWKDGDRSISLLEAYGLINIIVE